MGICEADLAVIAGLGPMPRRVCDLGDQDLHCYDESAFNALGFNAPKRGKARDFWLAIGCEHLSLDVVGEATRFDLNADSARPEWGQFDLVTNCGDTEHILNQLNCFTVIHDLTKAGGVMYHSLPVGGYAEHGFFNYNLKFFVALARANGYRMLDSCVGTAPSQPFNGIESESLARWLPKLPKMDAGLRIALRKTSNAPFSLPLDIPAEARPGGCFSVPLQTRLKLHASRLLRWAGLDTWR
jgi:hypothetical protein